MAGGLGKLVHEVRCRIRVTGVVASGIGVPDVNEDVWDRLTCFDVDDTDVHDLE